MDGPYHPDDKVWYYQVDQNKIKRGKKMGRWIRCKVVRPSTSGSMVVIDLGTRITQVNQSLIRRDLDTFSEIPIPLPDPAVSTPSAPAAPAARAAPVALDALAPAAGPLAPAEADEPVEDGSTSYAYALWQCCMQGKIEFLELFSGSAQISQCAALRGMRVAAPIDLRTGFDLNNSAGQKRAMKVIIEQQPGVIHMAPLCAPWSRWSNMKDDQKRADDRKQAMPMVRFCATVALHQVQHGRKSIIESPEESSICYVHCMQDLRGLDRVSYGDLNFCAFGLKDHGSNGYYKKPTSLLHNFSDAVLEPLWKTCPNTPTKKVQFHEHVEGYAKGFGQRSKLSQVYPYKFRSTLADILGTFLNVRGLNCDSLLINNILDISLEDHELGSVHKHLKNVLYQEFQTDCNHQGALNHQNLLATSLSPLPVKDFSTHQLMATINSLAKGKEMLLHIDNQTPLSSKLVNLAHKVRHFLPLVSFSKFSLLRGTFGVTMPVGRVGEESYILFWRKNDSNNWIYLLQVQHNAELLEKFDPSQWSFVHFWKDGGQIKQNTIEPPPGLIQTPQNDPSRPTQIPLKQVADDQLPGGHHLIPPTSAPSGSQDHELGGEGLRPQPALEPEVPEEEMLEASSKPTKTYKWETSPKLERTAPYGKDKGPSQR
jgi:hypothetical protein